MRELWLQSEESSQIYSNLAKGTLEENRKKMMVENYLDDSERESDGHNTMMARCLCARENLSYCAIGSFLTRSILGGESYPMNMVY